MKRLQRLPGSSSNSTSGTDLTYGGHPPPKLEATYEPMIIKEARYIAITMMKVPLISWLDTVAAKMFWTGAAQLIDVVLKW